MNEIKQIKQLIASCKEDLKSYNQEYKEYVNSLNNRPFDVKSFRLRGEVNNLNTLTYKIAECESKLQALKECLDIVQNNID